MQGLGSVAPEGLGLGMGAAGANGAARVLLVVDDPALAAVLEYHLRCEGFSVAATSGERLIGADAPVDLIIVDTDLAGVSVAAVCRSIRVEPGLRGAAVVMLLGGSEDEASLERLGFVPDHCLRKPFALADLGLTIAAALQRRSGFRAGP